MKNHYLSMAGGLALAFQFTGQAQNPSYLLVHSVKVKTETFTLFPPDLDPADIPVMQYEAIKPSTEEKTIITRVDDQYNQILEVVIDTLSRAEEWMEVPHRILTTPNGISAFTTTGDRLFSEPLSEEEKALQEEASQQIREEGYHPGFPVFPYPDSVVLNEFRTQGHMVSHPASGMVRVDFSGGGFLQFDRQNLVISEGFDGEEEFTEIHHKYVYDEDYGYLPYGDTELLSRKNDTLGLIMVTQRTYSEHQIQDNGILQKAEEERNGDVKFYPIPIESDLTVEGTRREVQIEMVYVKDQFGQVLYSYSGNRNHSLTLSTRQWPSGYLLIEVRTVKGTFAQPIIKP